MTEVEYAELHTPLFLAGTNLGQKLDPRKRHGMHMSFDDEKKRLIVKWGHKVAQIPEANIACFIEGTIVEPPKIVPAKSAMTAQVSTPQDHVFAGPGAGKTK